jgi:hypothetical protein
MGKGFGVTDRKQEGQELVWFRFLRWDCYHDFSILAGGIS